MGMSGPAIGDGPTCVSASVIRAQASCAIACSRCSAADRSARRTRRSCGCRAAAVARVYRLSGSRHEPRIWTTARPPAAAASTESEMLVSRSTGTWANSVSAVISSRSHAGKMPTGKAGNGGRAPSGAGASHHSLSQVTRHAPVPGNRRLGAAGRASRGSGDRRGAPTGAAQARRVSGRRGRWIARRGFHARSRSSASRRRPWWSTSRRRSQGFQPILYSSPSPGLPQVALVAQLEEIGERLGEHHRIALAWDRLSPACGALACGVACVCER